MSIVSSTIVENIVQRDGRRSVRERHVDHLGKVFFREYLADGDLDLNARLAAYAAQLAGEEESGEIAANIERVTSFDESPIFNYSTRPQLLAQLRDLYKDATKLQCLRISRYIYNLSLSDAAIKLLFGVGDAGLAVLKTKLQNQSALYDQIQSAIGQ